MNTNLSNTDELTLLYGDPTFAPPERLLLRAGQWNLIYEAGDLKYIRFGNTEVVRRIYVAVRDEKWGTIPGVLTERERTIGDNQFRLVYEARHVDAPKGIDFAWRGTLTGTPDGVVTFEMEGKSATPFLSNRTGICVLHPSECAGELVTVTHTDGTQEEGAYPDLIQPDQPFFDIAALTQIIAPNTAATIQFSGEVFEMEDQRNYLDASYKTYSRPQAWQKPYTVSPDEPIHQTVTVSLCPALKSQPISVAIGSESAELPEWGLMLPLGSPLPPESLLSCIGHLRVDIEASTEGWEETVSQVTALGDNIGLILGVRNAASLPDSLPVGENLRAVFLLTLTPDDLARAKQLFPPYLLFAASDRNFTNLNMNRPTPGSVTGIAFAANPQVHSTDNTSLMEAPYTLRKITETARSLGTNLKVALGPTYLSGYRKENDPRHRGLMGAAWYTAMACYAGLCSMDFYTLCDTRGNRGIFAEEGDPYPVFFALQAISELGATVLDTQVSDPLRIAAIATWGGGEYRILVANLTPEIQEVRLPTVKDTAEMRLLHSESLANGFSPPTPVEMSGQGTVVLPAFAIAKITIRNSK
jgi:hypothetical protein